MTLKENLLINWRVGFRIDIFSVLEEMEEEYENLLIASIDSAITYDSASEMTREDFVLIRAKLETLKTCGYLDEEELHAMVSTAEGMRLDKLEQMEEKEGEEYGSEEE